MRPHCMKNIFLVVFIVCSTPSESEAFCSLPSLSKKNCRPTKLSPSCYRFFRLLAKDDAKSGVDNEETNDRDLRSRDVMPRKINSYRHARRQQPSDRLQSSLTDLFSLSQRRNDDGVSSTQYEIEKNYELNVDVSFMESSSMEDAPLLDEEMYINSEEYMNSDGSIVAGSANEEEMEVPRQLDNLLSSLMNDAPEISSEEYTQSQEFSLPNNKRTEDDEDLLLSLSEKGTTMNSTLDSEELHRLVFSNEKGFLEQSEAFRESLSADSDQERKKEAETLRRGNEYRQRQEEAMAHILREMEEVEKTALSKEDAVKLSTQQNSDVSIVLCSKCSCRLSPEEIAREKRRGRSQANQMTCRLCQIEKMQVKNGSPYLMGRLDRNGNPVTSMGPSSVQGNEKVQRIRKIAPMTEDYALDDTLPKRKINEADSNAWREQFTNAMQWQQRGIVNSTNRPTATNNSTSDSTTFNRYSQRLMEPTDTKHSFHNVSAREAQRRAAVYRQNSQSFTTPTKVVQDTITPNTEGTSQNNVDEIQALLSRIRDLENTVSNYREKLDRSSKQIRGLQRLLDTMKNSQNNQQIQNAAIQQTTSVQENRRPMRPTATTANGSINSRTNRNQRTHTNKNVNVAKEAGENAVNQSHPKD